MLQFFNFIIDEWEIVSFSKERLKEAIKICLNKQNDFEDVMQSLSARDIGCTHIVSNDLKFYDCGIKISTGNEFLKIAND
jgi:predicted nucleic acid-binding protein